MFTEPKNWKDQLASTSSFVLNAVYKVISLKLLSWRKSPHPSYFPTTLRIVDSLVLRQWKEVRLDLNPESRRTTLDRLTSRTVYSPWFVPFLNLLLGKRERFCWQRTTTESDWVGLTFDRRFSWGFCVTCLNTEVRLISHTLPCSLKGIRK